MFAVQRTGVFVSISHGTHSLDASRAGNAINRAIRNNGFAHVVGHYAEIVGCAIGKAINSNRNLGGASVGVLSGRRPVGGFSLGERRRQFVLGAIIILRSREHIRQKMVESTLQHASLVDQGSRCRVYDLPAAVTLKTSSQNKQNNLRGSAPSPMPASMSTRPVSAIQIAGGGSVGVA